MKLTTYLDKFGLLERVEKAARADFDSLRKWNFVINHRAKGRFGCCKHLLVEVTSEYYVGGKVKEGEEADHENTLLHETAHAIVDIRHEQYGHRVKTHGPEWKSVMRALGANPARTGKSEILNESMAAKRKVTPPKHSYTCKDCGFEYKTKRELKNLAKRYHSGCKRKPNHGRLTHMRLR